MSEDFFDSILPPVKTMVEPVKEPQHSGIPGSSVLIADKTTGSGTNIEKLWEEIYTSSDDNNHINTLQTMHNSGNQQIITTIQQHINHPTNNKIISLNQKTIIQQSPNINNNKVFILAPTGVSTSTGNVVAAANTGGASKRKSQFINDQPSKEMRITPGNESRRIFQAALQNRNINSLSSQPIIAMENHEEEADEEAEAHTEVYSQYQPLKLRKGKVHPYPVVESSSLSSVEVPNIRYSLSLPPEITSEARLSNVQLEAVIYGCQRHEEILPTGERAGYLIGDGAGVGKGRTLAAIIYENYILRRKRSVWISVSNDLKHDAERDLRDLGADIDIHALNKMKYAKINSPENGNVKKGVLFSTYASLIGECQTLSKSKYRTRFRQIVQWFGTDYDGVVVFDECHKAKNLMPQGSQKKTKTAEIVLKLQETLPKARVVYASATGASEPRNMAYMTRLGLWGPGTPFKKFDDFVEKLEDKVGAMELVAVDMKQRGMYIARQLSFANVTFRVHEVRLAQVKIGDHLFIDVYNESVDLWTRIFDQMNICMNNKFVSKKHAKTIWGQYWAAHQRFFKYLCMAGKVQECVKITMDAITQQKCVVIGLQSTGEAKTNEMLEDYGGEVTEFVSCAKGILHSFVERFFPTEENLIQMDKREDKSKNNQINKVGRKKGGSKKPISLQDALGRHFLEKVTEEDELSSDASSQLSGSEESDASLSEKSARKRRNKARDDGTDMDEEDVEILMEDFSRRFEDNSSKSGIDISSRMIQRELLDHIERLSSKLPINTLDDLIRELGGPDYVAEMSGRKGRMVMDVNTCEVSYQPRREEDVTLEQINMVEKERFNTCHKLVAIISDAASTGISLHADKRYENSLQRVHITLELPWSADRAIQQFGRTHRSNQLYPPEYVFLISDLAGERRFASTVAKRLESLGALTHGDRRATETRDLSQFNIDNKFGRKALDHIFDTAFKGRSSLVPMPQGIDLQKSLDSVGLQPKDGKNVSKFLNRILGMRLEVQNALFQYYTDTMDELIRQAKRNQEFDRGIIDLAKEDDNIFVEETQDFRMIFLGDDIKVQLHRVKNITGLSWRSALEVPRGDNNSFDGFYITKNDTQRKIVLAVQKKDRHGTWFNVFSPNIGEQSNMIEIKTLNECYKKASLEDAERMWNEIYSITENRCLHYFWYKQCNYSRNCDTGCRSKIRYVLSGSIFYIWDIISSIHKSPQLARVRLNDGSKIIGCIINPSHKDRITEILANRESQPQQSESVSTTPSRQSQQQKDRNMQQRPIRPVQVTRLTSQDQYYVNQNLRNLSQRPPQRIGAPLTGTVVARYVSPLIMPQQQQQQQQQQRKMIFSSGIIVPQQQSHIRLVPIQNQKTIVSTGLRFASHPVGIRHVGIPQSIIHPQSSSSPQIFNSRSKSTKDVELPNSYIEFTE